MLSISVMSSGQVEYYLGLAQEDYYLNGGEPPGIWYGEGAKELHLTGTVKADDLRALFRGYSPSGVALVKNAMKEFGKNGEKKASLTIDPRTGRKKRKKIRDPGWDLTFSVPKSVSVLWSQADEALRKRIQKIIERAFRKAIGYLEAEAAYCRMGKGGKKKVKAKLVVAAFVHGTSRKLDPQYHIHGLALNAGLCPDGKFRALSSIDFFRHKMAAGVFFRVALAHELQEELGVKIVRPLDKKGNKKNWFEIDGVLESLMQSFSKRRQEIERALGKKGLESAAAAAVATLDTRETKGTIPPREELLRVWQEEGRQHGFTQATIGKLLGRVKRPDAKTEARRYQRALKEAVEQITLAESHFTELELLQKTLEAAQTWGLDADYVRASVTRDIQNPKKFVTLGARKGVMRYSTEEVLEVERSLIESADKLHKSYFKPIDEEHVSKILQNPHHPGVKGMKGRLEAKLGLFGEGIRLNEEQSAALRDLTQDEGRIKFLNGLAGTGKTTLLSAMREAYERQGYRVIGCSVAGVAAQGLQEGAGVESDTVKMRRKQMEADPIEEIKHHARQLVRAALHKPTYGLNRLKIDRRTVLVVDEAGMLGTKEFAELAKEVVRGGGIMICVGDHRQLPSIEAGGGFELLGKRVGQVDLQEIGRQTDHLDREMVKALVRGDAKLVLRLFAECGKLRVNENQEQTEERLIRDWKERGGLEQPKDHVIVVSTNQEVERYNALAQRERSLAGKLDMRQGVKVGEETMYPGDRVIFTQKARKLGVENGDRGVLVAVKFWGLGTSVAIELDRGQKTVIVPVQQLYGESYQGLQRGYAFTTHKLQGATVEHSYIHIGGRMTSKEMAYVQSSRHRDSVHLYTEKLEAGRQLTTLAREYQKKELARQETHNREEELRKEHKQGNKRERKGLDDLSRQRLPATERKPEAEFTQAPRQEEKGRREQAPERESKVGQERLSEHGQNAEQGRRSQPVAEVVRDDGGEGERRLPDLSREQLPARERVRITEIDLHPKGEIEPVRKHEPRVGKEQSQQHRQGEEQGLKAEAWQTRKEGLVLGNDKSGREVEQGHVEECEQSPKRESKVLQEHVGEALRRVGREQQAEPVQQPKEDRSKKEGQEVSPLVKQMTTSNAKTLAHEILESQKQRIKEEEEQSQSRNQGR